MPTEGGGEARDEAPASEPPRADQFAEQGRMRVIESGAQEASASEMAHVGTLPKERPPQPQVAFTPFQQRAMLPPSTSTTDSSPESTLSQRLPTLPGQESSGGDSGSRPGVPAAGAPRGGRPPLVPAPPRLPSAALLSGASSISIASPFMQQQISSALGSEGSSRWRSGGFTSTSSDDPPSSASPADAAATAAVASPTAAAKAAALRTAQPAEEDLAPTPRLEAEQEAGQTHMATVAEEGEEGDDGPTPSGPTVQQAAPEPAAVAVSSPDAVPAAPQLAAAQPQQPQQAAAQSPRAVPARAGISDWGPLPDDVAQLPPAQQAVVHASAACEAALRRHPVPAPAAAPADTEQPAPKPRQRSRAVAVPGQPPASGSPRQLAASGSPPTFSTKSSSRGGSLSSSGSRSGGSAGRPAAALQAAGTVQNQEQPLPSVAELPSKVPAVEAFPPVLAQPDQPGTPPVAMLPSFAQAQPFVTAAQQLPGAQLGTAAAQPGPQPQLPIPPLPAQTSHLSQVSLQAHSPPGYSPGGLSAWQAPLSPQAMAAAPVPAMAQLSSPLESFECIASPAPPPEPLAAHQQLQQQQQSAIAAADQKWQEQQQAAALTAALLQEQGQQQQQQQAQQAPAPALALHPATAAVLAAADPATRAVILAALQHQQQETAAATSEQQHALLSAQQQQQQRHAFLLAQQQQQQQQDLLENQRRAASSAASADRQQELLMSQAMLAAQQHHTQHVQAGLLPGHAQAAPYASFIAGSPLQGLQWPPSYAAGAPTPAFQQPAVPLPAPPPPITPSQLLYLQQLQQQASPGQADRQLSQALSGYSVGSELPGGVSMPLPQHPPPAQEARALHSVLPAGQPPLRYSPSPDLPRSLDGSAARQAAAAAGSAAAGFQQGGPRQQPPSQQATSGPLSDLSAFAGPGQHRPRVKAVISSGGRFLQPGAGGRASGGPSGGPSAAAAISAAAPGSWTYTGGETRLASLPDSCSFLELLAVLSSKKQRDAVAGFLSPRAASVAGGSAGQPGGALSHSPGTSHSSPAAAEAMTAGPLSIASGTKGSSSERPGGPSTGTAVASPASMASAADTLGTSGLASAAAAVAEAAGGRPSGLQKLCIVRYKLPSEPGLFVDVVDDEDVRLMFEEYADWVAEGSMAGAVGRKLHIFVEWLSPAQAGATSAQSADFELRGGAPGQAHFTPSDSSVEEDSPMVQRLSTKVSDLTSNKIEVIPAGEVLLLSHIGGGTFGDTYRGRWHESDVAVKCINPLMIGVQYASRQAWVDFLRDANQMGKLRHGNLCEVYGVVLPHDSDPRLAAPRSRSEPAAAGAGGSSAAAPAAGEAALAAAPPQLSLPSPAEAPQSPAHQAGGNPPPTGAALLLQREATLPPVASTMPQALPGPVANPPAIVMEFVAGRSLGSAIASGSDLVTNRLARVVYALDTAKALSYLHSRKIAHLDLKSGNVLLGWRDRRPTAKVAGYGLTGRKVSMVRCAAQGVTSSASMLPWTAPEVFRTPEYVTGKADVYSFAMVMFELWTLKKPFAGCDAMELLAAVLAGEVVRPILPGVGGEPPVEEPGPGWRELLERCWAEDPEQRPDFSVIEEELRGIAREVKRQQGQQRARPPAAASRSALPPGLPRPRSGTNLAAAAAAQDPATPTAAASPREGQRAEGLARPGSGFLINSLPDSGVWAPAGQPLPEGRQAAEASADQQQPHHAGGALVAPAQVSAAGGTSEQAGAARAGTPTTPEHP